MNSENHLFTWISKGEVRKENLNDGYTKEVLTCIGVTHLFLLSDLDRDVTESYKERIQQQLGCEVTVQYEAKGDPSELHRIYGAALSILEKHRDKYAKANVYYLFSGGTPFHGAIWFFLNMEFPGKLVKTSREKGTEIIDYPFDVYARYRLDKLIGNISLKHPLQRPFEDMRGSKSKAMQAVIRIANKVASYKIPVLITGPTGTGKQVMAAAIHAASKRNKKQMVSLNCAAIPEGLIESELFGHKRGAFTGADSDRDGKILLANNSTLFLDEVADLSLNAQIKLLTVLEESSFYPVGGNTKIEVDFRLIAATNKSLVEEVAAGKFREDLYYRLCGALIQIPALKDRAQDLVELIDHFWNEKIPEELKIPKNRKKTLSPGARLNLESYSWPGNIRELKNCLMRLYVWSSNREVTEDEVKQMYIPKVVRNKDILNRPLGKDFSLDHLRAEVDYHYIERALILTDGKWAGTKAYLGIEERTVSNRHKSAKALLGYPEEEP